MLLNTPLEMRAYNQWFVWRLQWREDDTEHLLKPTKVPYQPWAGGGKGDVTDERTWASFDQARALSFTCVEPCDPKLPVSYTGYTGVGFVLTKNDPFVFIDCDDTKGNHENAQRQLKLYKDCNSYSELSPSKQGCHIIVKGELPGPGRRRADIEIYDENRYMTMTGDVINNEPIKNCQEIINILYHQLGAPATVHIVVEDSEEKLTDDKVVETASSAANGEVFLRLWRGEWESNYSSQSEADFALLNIIGFYSRNRAQIKRIFRTTALGQRPKAQRDNYLDPMIDRTFDNQTPPVDMEGLLINGVAMGGAGESITGLGSQSPAPNSVSDAERPDNAATDSQADFQPPVNPFPPGLIGEVAQYIYESAPRPVREIALAGAIAFLAGICGKAYNISGTGLNQYILLLAQTGTGKDVVSDATNKLLKECAGSVPAIMDFKGPGELVSSAGIVRFLADKSSCVFSIIGEFGKKMHEMSSPTANAHLTGISRTLLQLYSKSGQTSIFDPIAYSDITKNTKPILSPSLTIFGESVPESFYEILDERMIEDGLLPRFLVFEYRGKREFLNHGHSNVMPPIALLSKLIDLSSFCLGANQKGAHNVKMSADAALKFNEYDQWTTNQINSAKNEIHRMLWNRAHLKATKLAALFAVGMNYIDPVIDMHGCLWATNLVSAQTDKLIAKFDSGTTGAVGGSEARQQGEIIKVITSFLTSPWERYKGYGGTKDMHAKQVVLEGHISRRVQAMACFRNDRMGPTIAIKRTLKALLDNDELRELPVTQMIENFGCKPKAFMVSNPTRFVLTPEA